MITVFVQYREWEEAPHPLLNDKLVERSKIVEVEKLTDLNDMFPQMFKVDVLKDDSHDSH